eukprot:gnl/Chilomastix_cuspidata/7193.p1 GENE.gnl/Chilomastix_cuspidata/7193~~gnl/Chilomastix_cuspidata/7193.p1  ORF type:complete len:560 (+),score=149.00 gnl/Chilomastix_cuspidata/7193:29-1708(+)
MADDIQFEQATDGEAQKSFEKTNASSLQPFLILFSHSQNVHFSALEKRENDCKPFENLFSTVILKSSFLHKARSNPLDSVSESYLASCRYRTRGTTHHNETLAFDYPQRVGSHSKEALNLKISPSITPKELYMYLEGQKNILMAHQMEAHNNIVQVDTMVRKLSGKMSAGSNIMRDRVWGPPATNVSIRHIKPQKIVFSPPKIVTVQKPVASLQAQRGSAQVAEVAAKPSQEGVKKILVSRPVANYLSEIRSPSECLEPPKKPLELDYSNEHTRYWSDFEHAKYLWAIFVKRVGSRDEVSAIVRTRTPKQVNTHNQKYKLKIRQYQRNIEDNVNQILEANYAELNAVFESAFHGLLEFAKTETPKRVQHLESVHSPARAKRSLRKEAQFQEFALTFSLEKRAQFVDMLSAQPTSYLLNALLYSASVNHNILSEFKATRRDGITGASATARTEKFPQTSRATLWRLLLGCGVNPRLVSSLPCSAEEEMPNRVISCWTLYDIIFSYLSWMHLRAQTIEPAYVRVNRIAEWTDRPRIEIYFCLKAFIEAEASLVSSLQVEDH